MTACFIAEIEITDLAGYTAYAQAVPGITAKFGGRYLVRGGATAPLEGGWSPKRLIVIEFTDMAAAESWYRSPEYQAILPKRLAASTGKALLVEGFDQGGGGGGGSEPSDRLKGDSMTGRTSA
jgi:uncharacterized protein (DUF1330 family)